MNSFETNYLKPIRFCFHRDLSTTSWTRFERLPTAAWPCFRRRKSRLATRTRPPSRPRPATKEGGDGGGSTSPPSRPSRIVATQDLTGRFSQTRNNKKLRVRRNGLVKPASPGISSGLVTRVVQLPVPDPYIPVHWSGILQQQYFEFQFSVC